MKKSVLLISLLFGILSYGQFRISHKAIASNTNKHITTIDNNAVNSQPDVILIVTQKFGVYNPNEIGVWYNKNKWHIFNQNLKTMPTNAEFNILVFPKNSKRAFVHTTRNSNTKAHITTLEHSLTNGKSDALVFITQNYGAYNTSKASVWYNVNKWKIYNEDTSKKMPLNTKFNVLVLRPERNKIGDLNLFAFKYQDKISKDHISIIASPLQMTSKTEIFVTGNYKGVYNPNVVGVWKAGTKWTVFNQNKKQMPNGVQFNILATNDPIAAIVRPPAPEPVTPTYTKRVRLPLFNREETISYKVDEGLAIFQDDIILGSRANVLDPGPEPLPTKMDFSRYGRIQPTSSGIGSTTSALITRIGDGIIDRNWLWPNGVIPYSIESGDFSNAEIRVILDGIREINTRTNLNIVPKWKTQNHVHFKKNADMRPAGRSKVGRGRIFQRLYLNQNVSVNTVIHELLHAAGAWHEQSRSDRDRFVRINFENILEDAKHNFKKHTTDGYKVTPYDRNSIMHYGGMSFSKNGLPTIVDVRTGNAVAPSGRLTAYDIDGINNVYPYDYYSDVIRTPTSIRTVKTTIKRVQSDDQDGGRKHEIDFYMKNETGPGWDWRPGNGSNPTERFKSGTVENSTNDISPNWEFRYTIAADEPFAKVWLKLRDDDGRSGTEGGVSPDENLDINPFNGIYELELFIDTASGEIFLGDVDGVRRDEQYIGSVGEDIEMEGFEGGMKAYVLFKIEIE